MYPRSYIDRRGKKCWTKTFTIAYPVGKGKIKAEATKATTRKEAEAILLQRRAEIARLGEFTSTSSPERVLMNQLFDLLIEDYKLQERKSLYDTELRVNLHLRPYWGKRKAQDIGTQVIHAYIDKRKSQGAEANATINKELSWVRRAMNLGFRHDPPLVRRIPYFPMLPIDNARTGTLACAQYRAVRDRLPGYARIALVISYHYGNRKGEIGKIRRDHVDWRAMRILVPGRITKNGEPKYLPIYGELEKELKVWMKWIEASECSYLIQDQGQRVFSFDKAWKSACKKAGVPETLFHDLRRTAATNMIEAGYSEKEAMEMGGWKTAHVFRRYHIVSSRRMQANAKKLADYLATKEEEERRIAADATPDTAKKAR